MDFEPPHPPQCKWDTTCNTFFASPLPLANTDLQASAGPPPRCKWVSTCIAGLNLPPPLANLLTKMRLKSPSIQFHFPIFENASKLFYFLHIYTENDTHSSIQTIKIPACSTKHTQHTKTHFLKSNVSNNPFVLN